MWNYFCNIFATGKISCYDNIHEYHKNVWCNICLKISYIILIFNIWCTIYLKISYHDNIQVIIKIDAAPLIVTFNYIQIPFPFF